MSVQSRVRIMAKPGFLGIGVPRAATTLLHTLLVEQPGVCMAVHGRDFWGKELHYFDRDVERLRLCDYEALFADKSCSAMDLHGEITPNYAGLPDKVVERIATYLGPRARVVLVLRDPAERVLSHYLKNRRAGIGEEVQLRQIVRYCQKARTLAYTRYNDIIHRWQRNLPVDGLLVITYDEITRDTCGALSRVLDFLQVDCTPTVPGASDSDRINSSASNGDCSDDAVLRYLHWKFESERSTTRLWAGKSWTGAESLESRWIERVFFCILEFIYLPTKLASCYRFWKRGRRLARALDLRMSEQRAQRVSNG